MNDSILLKVQSEITDILVAENPDEEISIYSRTKGDVDSDVINSLAALAQGISILEAEVDATSPNVASCVRIDKASILIQCISGTAMEPKYDASQLAEWVAGLLHQLKLKNSGGTVYVDGLKPYKISDDEGRIIDGAKGVSVELKIINLSLPKIPRGRAD